MNKKLILLLALLSDVPVMAMEHAKEIPSGKEASRNEEETLMKIRLTDSANSEITHEVTIPIRLAKLIGALNIDLLENPNSKGSVFPLSNVTIAIWRFIEPQLERIYGITHDASQAAQLRQEIIAEFSKLDVKSLIGVICASDYLEIPILLESACEAVKQSALDKISWEELEEVPFHIRNQIIMNNVLMLLGAVPGRELEVCRGHEGKVNAVCVTKDGRIVSGSEDGTVLVWDSEGNQLVACRGHEGWINAVCVTQDGKIVSGSDDGTVRVWDMEGNQLTVCRGHGSVVSSVCVTKDGKIVSGSFDNTVRVWDTRGHQMAECRGHESYCRSVCVTHDGKIVSGSDDRTVRVWNMEGNLLAVCRGHQGIVLSVCVTKDGKIVSGSWDKTMRICDMEGNQLAVCRGHEDWVTSVCITEDGKIFSGSRDETVRVWDIQGNQLAQCRGHEDLVRSICVMQDGKIISGSYDATVRVWDIGLLSKIVCMDDDLARVLWELVQNIPQLLNGTSDGQKHWEKIEHLLGIEVPVASPRGILGTFSYLFSLCKMTRHRLKDE